MPLPHKHIVLNTHPTTAHPLTQPQTPHRIATLPSTHKVHNSSLPVSEYRYWLTEPHPVRPRDRSDDSFGGNARPAPPMIDVLVHHWARHRAVGDSRPPLSRGRSRSRPCCQRVSRDQRVSCGQRAVPGNSAGTPFSTSLLLSR